MYRINENLPSYLLSYSSGSILTETRVYNVTVQVLLMGSRCLHSMNNICSRLVNDILQRDWRRRATLPSPQCFFLLPELFCI